MKRRIDSLWTLLGSTLFGVGVVCLLLKAVLPEYVDGSGLLHEAFFLLPVGYCCLFGGMVALAVIHRRKKSFEED